MSIGRKSWYEPVMWALMLLFAWSLILSIAVVQTVAILMTVLWLVHGIRQKSAFVRTEFDVAILLFLAARVVSIPFSINPGLSLEALWKELIYYPLFFVVTQELRLEKRMFRWILWSFAGSGILAAIYGSVQYFSGNQIRATSMVSGPVTLGMYLAALTSMVLVLGRNRELIPKSWIWFGSTGLLLVGIIASLNRIHWGIMLVMIGVAGLLRERKLLLILAAGVLVAVVSPPVSKRITDSFTSVTELMNGRDIIWLDALKHAGERPLTGFGPRTFHEVFTGQDVIRDKEVGSWHNDYLQMYMESGILGFAAFVWVMILVFRKGVKAWKVLKGDAFWGDVLLALLVAMVAFYLSALVGGFVIDPLNSLFHRFLLAMLALISANAGTLAGSPQGVPRKG